ncbi:hypothetical protein Sgleb_19240 [Streptomyces glebosus]|uniref:Uncharacterized protein n=1 Tax=Streptomyces glebosus TaxID=249580 RepID=A0A640SRB1_9ACTN|nr:hypothetical protein Sgleb_19240 [Streptomyces glebosus]GHG89454.1 hypothetical protein GCM10010513_72140 [Streptomyces glebosus]
MTGRLWARRLTQQGAPGIRRVAASVVIVTLSSERRVLTMCGTGAGPVQMLAPGDLVCAPAAPSMTRSRGRMPVLGFPSRFSGVTAGCNCAIRRVGTHLLYVVVATQG